MKPPFSYGFPMVLTFEKSSARRQVNNYFLPKTAAERRAVKQKTTAMLSAKVSEHPRPFGKLPGLVNSHIAKWIFTIFHGTIHYFYGHVQ